MVRWMYRLSIIFEILLVRTDRCWIASEEIDLSSFIHTVHIEWNKMEVSLTWDPKVTMGFNAQLDLDRFGVANIRGTMVVHIHCISVKYPHDFQSQQESP